MAQGIPQRLSEHEFELAVEEALAMIPAELLAHLRNVAIFVEAEPPEGEDPDLLGLYEGVPLTDGEEPWFGSLPDRILIFQGPLERLCETRQELLDEIAITVAHEVAHHFGIDDDRLHELGWG
ncbi:MAG TPA: metallopeptidase family protein [Dermatophilaceae bacterium]|jgi:predicted Zn-dependent protease with MMP-like domain|nr:metallopeptidase family protein [Actinomycetales bacterium]HMT31985.1 metallopeptidase family protein [Dermatophilaceae bacterium]HMT88979.1 metallopeptidase family protein [Dermatophilaceae bacterium]